MEKRWPLKKIVLTRACAASEDVIAVTAVLKDAEIYDPDARAYQYRHRADLGEHWYYEDFKFSVQDIAVVTGDGAISPYFVLLSAEGDVYHFSDPDRFQEKIDGAGTTSPDSRFYGKMLSIEEVNGTLYACGAGGQIYIRGADGWKLLSDAVLHNSDAELSSVDSAPDMHDPAWGDWIIQQALNPVTREVVFYDLAGSSEDNIYICGTERTKPMLCHWDGTTLQELSLPINEGALTDVYVESEESIWVCGREGIVLHGNRHRGFVPISADTRLNLFHSMTPYRGKLVLPSSVRPGGLYELDRATGGIGKFDPPMPRLTSRNDADNMEGGPFFAQAVGGVLWVVASKDIFRFDGTTWERVTHPDI